MKTGRKAVTLGPLLTAAQLWASLAAAETREQRVRDDGDEGDIDHTIVVGVGGAGELELGDGSFHPGANVMVEWDAIENWLEFEVEASILAADHGIEVPVGLLVKKPFRLTRRLELMIGVGPEVVQVSTPTNKGTYVGGQVALDVMFWPTRHIGVWIEPAYDFTFRDGVSHGVGSTGGILFGL